jgi:acyl carrier protein
MTSRLGPPEIATILLVYVVFSGYGVGIPDKERTSMSKTDVLEHVWTVQELEALTLDLLADLLGRDVGELGMELHARGTGMPVDSLDMFDVLQEFRLRTGLKLPVRDIRRDTLRSVKAFAQFAVGGTRD